MAPDLDDLAALCGELLAACPAVKSCDLDPTKLHTLPGVWVEVTGFQPLARMDGAVEVDLRLVVVSPRDDQAQVLHNLGDATEELLAAVDGYGAPGRVQTVSVNLPGRADLPGYRFPLTVTQHPRKDT